MKFLKYITGYTKLKIMIKISNYFMLTFMFIIKLRGSLKNKLQPLES